MATKYHNLSDHNPEEIPSGKGKTFSIIVSEWNPEVTHSMCRGAVDLLLKYGVEEEDILISHVPGSFELIHAASKMARGTGVPNAIIAIGSVVRGDTPHFDYICESVAVNLGALSRTASCPIIFGVLTTDTMEQALERAGGIHGNKGTEAAVTALKMADRFGW